VRNRCFVKNVPLFLEKVNPQKISHPSIEIEPNRINYGMYSRLGGVVVSVATGPKGREFKPGRGDGFLRAINIRNTPSFRWEVKPDAPYRKTLRRVK
jgi:hypothetical protein